MADQLATPEDLASLLQDTDLDRATCELLIESATAVVQAITGQRIVQVVDDQVSLDIEPGDNSQWLTLPQSPVTAVTSAFVGSTPVTDFVPHLSRGRIYRAAGWRSGLADATAAPSTVVVTYTHGYPAGDQRLQLARTAVLSLAKGAYVNPSGVYNERIDDYAVSYEKSSAALEASPFLRDALRRQYARPSRSARLVAT